MRLLALAAAGVLLAQPAQAEDRDALFRAAVAARDAGRWRDSLDLMQRLHALAPEPELLNNIGWLQVQLGEYAAAQRSYEGVIADPGADPELVRVDRERLAELAGKLDHAWVVLESAPTNASILVDGIVSTELGKTEQPLPPGEHVLEVHRRGTPLVILRRVALERGRRLLLGAKLFEHPEVDAAIVLDGIPAARVVVGGYTLRTSPGTFHTISVDPGRHTVAVELASGEALSAELELSAGERRVLAREPAITVRLPRPVEDPAVQLTAEPPSRGAPGVVAIAAGGAAVALAAAGVVLFLSAASDADRVAGAPRREDGVLTGITLAEARALQDDASTKTTAGAALFVGAGVGVVSGLVAWLLQDPE